MSIFSLINIQSINRCRETSIFLNKKSVFILEVVNKMHEIGSSCAGRTYDCCFFDVYL